MKNKISVLFFTLIILGNVGCGNTSSTSKTQSPLMAKHGVELVSNANSFAGTWIANVECGLMLIKINPTGSTTIMCDGDTFQEKLVKNASNQYFITNTSEDMLMPLKKSNTGLLITTPEGDEILFTSAGNY